MQIMFAEQETGQDGGALIPTFIWGVLVRFRKIRNGISIDIADYVEKVCQFVGLPIVRLEVVTNQPLTFEPSALPRRPEVAIKMHAVEFQLLHGGPFMERSMDSLPDSRTPDFEPDRWQRDVLDQIDAKKSVFVVAPTSAGKTFIS